MKISIPQVLLSVCYVLLSDRAEAAEVSALRGSNVMDRELGRCDYECPKHSVEKAGRKCMDSFDDCECDPGYFKTNDEVCAAPTGLCTEASVEAIQHKQAQVYGWLDLAKTKATWDEKVECIDNLNKVLSDVWTDYNAVKASCENELDGELDGAIGDFFRGIPDFVVGVAEDVAEFVVDAAEEVGDFVVEALDDAKCFLVGGAFKVLGFAADLALTVATGGANKLSKAACKGSQAVNKGKFLAGIAEGVSSAACSINEKVDSDVLSEVCDFRGDIEAPNNRQVLRFVKTFQNAVCGQPGKALGKILEDVVDCEIDCASKSNLFCGN
ncbi:MAG: hypothetical protein SGARI_000851 [Bacillariaceae sp.]